MGCERFGLRINAGGDNGAAALVKSRRSRNWPEDTRARSKGRHVINLSQAPVRLKQEGKEEQTQSPPLDSHHHHHRHSPHTNICASRFHHLTIPIADSCIHHPARQGPSTRTWPGGLQSFLLPAPWSMLQAAYRLQAPTISIQSPSQILVIPSLILRLHLPDLGA